MCIRDRLTRRPSSAESTHLLMPFVNPNQFTCAAAATGDPAPVVDPAPDGIKRLLQPPQVTREVRPRYLQIINKPGDSWTVWVSVLLSSEGCVQELETVKGDYLDFNAESLRVVSQWAFEPAKLDGRAVPSEVIVEVSFFNK